MAKYGGQLWQNLVVSGLSKKGLSTREIAEVTGWSHMTIARDLAVTNVTKSVSNDTAARHSATGKPETKARRAKVAEAAAAEGVTRPAVAAKLIILRQHVAWWDKTVRPEGHQPTSAPVRQLAQSVAERQTGIDHRVVSRWRAFMLFGLAL